MGKTTCSELVAEARKWEVEYLKNMTDYDIVSRSEVKGKDKAS